MSLSNEERERIKIELAKLLWAKLPAGMSTTEVEEYIGTAIDRALSPDLMPKPGQIVRYKYRTAVSPDIREYSGSNIDLEGCEWWRVIVTADECLEALEERTYVYPNASERETGRIDGLTEAADLIRRRIAEAPRSSE